MNTVKIKSYAKVNLTLEITGVENGYHMLDSLVANVDLFDLIVLKKRKGGLSCVTMKGMGSEEIPPEKNNALKAAEAFSKRFGTDGAEIKVYKNIPIGAGLGGSSADICGVINGMARLYKITDRTALKELADTLGSDTGYMLNGGFARMRGRGELVENLSACPRLNMLLLCPQSQVSAGACYKKYDEEFADKAKKKGGTQACIEALLKKDFAGVGESLMNDLYLPAAALNDDVAQAFASASAFSPLGTVMTGSGSAVLALFETEELCEWAKSRYKGKFAAYVVRTITPDYVGKTSGGWRNPFELSQEEQDILSGE